jgi:hypothetical protein
MADTMSAVKNKIQDVSNSVGQAASCAAENVKNVAGNFADVAKAAACNMSKEGQQAASYVGQKAGEATSVVGDRLRAAGDAIRQNVPQEGSLGQASNAVASTLENTGDYIKREGLEGMFNDVTCMIKKNPIQSLFVGIGLGFLMARATSNRS